MRAVSSRFKDLGLGKKDSSANNDEYDGSPGNSPQAMRPNHYRSASGTGVDGFGKSIKSKVAHTTILPNIIGSSSLRELQDFITAEKGVLQSSERMSSDVAKSAQTLSTWGSSEGSDLSDVLSHASSILMHLSQAFATYAGHEEGIRRTMKSIRTKEEELEETIKRRRNIGSRAEREEKKLAKMGQENKNLPSQTELLESLRSQMKEMDTDILTEEAKLGDFKRRSTKEALSQKFGGILEFAEKATIVGELGKLLIEEIPLEETPPGYGRSPYQGFEQTQRLSREADRCVKEVVFSPPRIVSLPPGLPHHQPLDSLQTDSNAGHGNLDDFKRYAAEYGDEPIATPNRGISGSVDQGYTPDQSNVQAHPAMATGLGAEYSYNAETGQYDLQGVDQGSRGHEVETRGHVLFAGPLSPAVIRSSSSYAPVVPAPATQLSGHDYEYEQAQAAQDEWNDVSTHQEPERETAPLQAPAEIETTHISEGRDVQERERELPLAPPLPLGASLAESMRSYMSEGPRSPISPEAPSPAKAKIMDRGRANRQFGDGPGDQAHGGYNYNYDSTAFFVRNHASSPADLPQQEQVFPPPASEEPVPAVEEEYTRASAQREMSRDRAAMGLDPVAPNRPSSPSAAYHRAAAASAGAGKRTISAGAFRRNKPTPAIASGQSPSSPSNGFQPSVEIGSPRQNAEGANYNQLGPAEMAAARMQHNQEPEEEHRSPGPPAYVSDTRSSMDREGADLR